MHRILTASLFLSTVLLHAQTATTGQSVTLEARSGTPNALAAVAPALPASDTYLAGRAVRISTGATKPKLIIQPEPGLAVSDFNTVDLATQKMVLHFVVNASGVPTDIHIVQSVNPEVDARVVAAVQHYRYTPSMLDGQVIPREMNLVMNFQTR